MDEKMVLVPQSVVDRAYYLLCVTEALMKEEGQCIESQVFYDDAVCDASCLGDDCEYAAGDLEAFVVNQYPYRMATSEDLKRDTYRE